MNDTLRLNAFQLVRPQAAVEAPSKAPRKTNHSRAPKQGNVHLLLDSNGRQTVSLERRPSGITIENREQRLANEAKLARLVGGVR
jgi:hypothetical protein